MKQPVYMLAADHRWQWEEWCDGNAIARERIADAKALALEGLLEARDRSVAARTNGALLIDRQYGAPALARAVQAGLTVGTPAERAGVFPLEWTDEPFARVLPGDFAKVLVRYRPEWSPDAKAAQVRKLSNLAGWCAEHHKPLLIEVIIPRLDEPEETFEASGRAALLATVVAECYQAGVVPDYWKIEGTPDSRAMQAIDESIAVRPSSRLLILGKGAGFDSIDAWFRAAAVARTAAGFAIGRSVYWQPAVEFLRGACDRAAAVNQIALNYLRVIESWEAARAA